MVSAAVPTRVRVAVSFQLELPASATQKLSQGELQTAVLAAASQIFTADQYEALRVALVEVQVLERLA